MNLEMLEDRVLVEPDEAPEKSKGGVYLPERVREQQRPARGKVLAVGPGRRNDQGLLETVPVAVGDVIIYGAYAGHDYEHEGTTYKIVGSKDILAKIRARR